VISLLRFIILSYTVFTAEIRHIIEAEIVRASQPSIGIFA